MATQTDIDSIADRMMDLRGTVIDFENAPVSFLEASWAIAEQYLSLRDPTPITPEGLEAEFSSLERISDTGWCIKGTGCVIDTGHGMNNVTVAFPRGHCFVKTMGQLRLAMMQARGAK